MQSKQKAKMPNPIYAPINLSIFICSLGIVLRPVATQQANAGLSNEDAIDKFREKYNSESIIRDTEHIKEDLKHLIDLQKEGTISNEQSIFYVMRMHDFDNNNLLDGLELMKIVSHSTVLRPDIAGLTVEQLEALVDAFLHLDANQDGFISYAEWVDSNRRSQKSETNK